MGSYEVITRRPRPPSQCSSTISDCTSSYRRYGSPRNTHSKQSMTARPQTVSVPQNGREHALHSNKLLSPPVVSSMTKQLHEEFERRKKEHSARRRMKYSISPLYPDQREKSIEFEASKGVGVGWNTRFRAHDISLERKKAEARPWTSASAMNRSNQSECGGRMTALSETQKELGSYFKCLDEEKYMMTIPPLQPKPTEENPYLNFSRPPLAPPQPRRPIRCIEEKVSPQLNPFYGKQILWPKEQNFDLKQYTLMYKASKECVRQQETSWLAFWKTNGKRGISVKSVGHPFECESLAAAATRKGTPRRNHQRVSTKKKVKCSAHVWKR